MNAETFRQAAHKFVDHEIKAQLPQWEADGSYPKSLHKRAADYKLLSLGLDAGQRHKSDIVHRRALIEELTLSGAQAMMMGLASHFVSLTVIELANPALSEEILPAIQRGEKIISLALTEPQAGSDIRNTESKAVYNDNGCYLISGEKCFICNGGRADYLLVSAMLEKQAALFLVATKGQAIHARLQSCLGWKGLPISALTLKNIKARLVAEPEQTGTVLQAGLSQERLHIAIMALASARLVLGHAITYAKERIVQGHPLFKQQVIRYRLAELHSTVETCGTYLDALTAQADARTLSGSATAIAKNQCVAVLSLAAPFAVQVLGGSGCMTGSITERIYRDSKLLEIGGGTTEMMNEIISRSL